MTTTVELITEDVPSDIRTFAEWFISWYGIDGICDPMYVCNITAMLLNRGNGCNDFEPGIGETHDNPRKTIIERLSFSFSTSIERSGRETAHIGTALDIFDRAIRPLVCCCCGKGTHGRQWWNRDKGFGLCPDCVEFVSRSADSDDLHSCYGICGIHYATTNTTP